MTDAVLGTCRGICTNTDGVGIIRVDRWQAIGWYCVFECVDLSLLLAKQGRIELIVGFNKSVQMAAGPILIYRYLA